MGLMRCNLSYSNGFISILGLKLLSCFTAAVMMLRTAFMPKLIFSLFLFFMSIFFIEIAFDSTKHLYRKRSYTEKISFSFFPIKKWLMEILDLSKCSVPIGVHMQEL